MADFPIANNFAPGTSINFEDGIVIDRATNGLARARNFYTARKLKATLVLIGMSPDMRDTLMAFYDSYRNAEFGLTLDGVHYGACLFTGPPDMTPIEGSRYYNFRFNVIQV